MKTIYITNFKKIKILLAYYYVKIFTNNSMVPLRFVQLGTIIVSI